MNEPTFLQIILAFMQYVFIHFFPKKPRYVESVNESFLRQYFPQAIYY